MHSTTKRLVQLCALSQSKGASERQLQAVEKRWQCSLPEPLRSWLAIADGLTWPEHVTLYSCAQLRASNADARGARAIAVRHDEDTVYSLKPAKRGWALEETHESSTRPITFSALVAHFEDAARKAKSSAAQARPRARAQPKRSGSQVATLLANASTAKAHVARIVSALQSGERVTTQQTPQVLSVVTSLTRAGRVLEAEAVLSAVRRDLVLQGTDTLVVKHLVAALCAQKQSDALVRLCSACIDADPRWDAYYHRALGHMWRDDFEAAVCDYEQSIALFASSEANNNLAHCLFKLGRFKEAKPIAKAAVKLKPANAFAHVTLANVLAALGDVDAAVAAFNDGVARGYVPKPESLHPVLAQHVGV